MDVESGISTRESRLRSYRTTLCLAYQSLGVVYGDLSTSPIYVYTSTFSGSLSLYEEDHEILGVLSLIFWTLTIIPLLKYIIFVLRADDDGEGGTFALYSLLCRHSRMGLLNSSYDTYETKSSNKSIVSSKETRTGLHIKDFFEKHQSSRIILLLVVLLGTSMVIGDGVLTPTMSVLSAVSGIKIKVTHLHEDYTVVLACIILMGLFALQHYGTHRVGFLFAPIMASWLLSIAGVGIYNIVHWNPGVIRALSPYYIYNFFKITGRHGWSSLGGIVLCITGAEAMFADLGHFSQASIKIAFTGAVYPCLVLAYMGEAAYLSKNRTDVHRSFYQAVPDVIFWPVFIIATLATVVGSQAIISATFSIINQCRALSCFPRVKVIHTSDKIHGQIYIPEVNWILMVLCIAVVLGFRDTNMIGHAYGLAVITVMFVTTCLMFLIISTVWRKNAFFSFIFVAIFGSVELIYFSACLAKVHVGGWLPLVISTIIMSLMCSWHYGTLKKQSFEIQNKVCLDRILSIGPSLGMCRVPGIGLIYSNIASGVPPMFAHFVTNFPAFHQILIFVTLKSVMVPRVPIGERFLVGRIGARENRLFRCVASANCKHVVAVAPGLAILYYTIPWINHPATSEWFGYKDVKDSYNFETVLLEKLAEFLHQESQNEDSIATRQSLHPPVNEVSPIDAALNGLDRRRKVTFCDLHSNQQVKELLEAQDAGIAYMMGNTYIMANGTSPFIKKVAIDFIYGFLRRNCRRAASVLKIPHTSLIEVGMVYNV